MPVRKTPRGFYARYGREHGLSLNAVHRKFNPDKLPCVREKQECDTSAPWGAAKLIAMDRAFCAAMEREIGRGSERPRGSARRERPVTAALAPASAFAVLPI